jgi:outer membrane biosynthesis protein TonB
VSRTQASIPALPWTASQADERRFRIIVSTTIILALIFSFIMPLIELPKKERTEVEKLPPRLAKMLLEKKKKPVPPKVKAPVPKKEKPKVKEKKPDKKPEPKPKAAPKKPEVKPKPKAEVKPKPKPKPDPEAARKKAASAGVLAMQDMLADLREAQPVAAVKSTKRLQTSGTKQSVKARSILVAKASKGSGGIDASKFARTSGGADLSGRDVTEVDSNIENIVASDDTEDVVETGGRSLAEIQRVIEANKAAIFSIYQRALRKNPSLQGKVVFKLIIEPSGIVSECQITSSELGDSKLERKLTLRLKRINFGAKDVETTHLDYPINFLPN